MRSARSTSSIAISEAIRSPCPLVTASPPIEAMDTLKLSGGGSPPSNFQTSPAAENTSIGPVAVEAYPSFTSTIAISNIA